MKQLDKQSFWRNIQALIAREGISLTELCDRAKLSYNTITVQKARPSYPKLEQICSMSVALDVSLDRLVYGEDSNVHYSARVKAIADACENVADPEELYVVEKILGIKKTDVYTVSESAEKIG